MTSDLSPATDYRAITNGQQQTWSEGDCHQIARLNVVMAEAMCDAGELHAGERVLDAACGSGIAALVAARRYCQVTGIDYVPSLLDRARMRADADGLEVDFLEADAQELLFEDDTFDAVLSVYGAQFAPDQRRAAEELLRVTRPGGRIVLASPAPYGWSGDFFPVHARHNPPPPGLDSPLRWGTEEGLTDLFGSGQRSSTGTRPSTRWRCSGAGSAPPSEQPKHLVTTGAEHCARTWNRSSSATTARPTAPQWSRTPTCSP